VEKYSKLFEGMCKEREKVFFKEDFLQYLWKFQLLKLDDIKTVDGSPLHIVKPGLHNVNSGPDFLMGQLRMGGKLWVGHIEIHLKSSDWYLHQHHKDPAYDPVILHVVWEYDMPILAQNGVELNCVAIKEFVATPILERYQQFLSVTHKWILCEHSIDAVERFTLKNWMDRLYVERLETKSVEVELLLDACTHDWEAVLFQLLSATFGLHLNKTAFLNLAHSFEFSLLRKLQEIPSGVTSLLFGQAGFLMGEKEDDYYLELQESYAYVSKKHGLTPLNTTQFQFFRLRPPNFPTIRIAQLASLYETNRHLFSKILKAKTAADFYQLFQVRTPVYWDTHYVFGKTSKTRVKKVSKSLVDLLLINAIIPLKYVYLKIHKAQDVSELEPLIQSLKAENNSSINRFKKLKIACKNAYDSQALLQLKKEYCDKKRCLHCAIGLQVLGKCCVNV